MCFYKIQQQSFMKLQQNRINRIKIKIGQQNLANSRWDNSITWEWDAWRVFLALKKRIVHEKDTFSVNWPTERLSKLNELAEPIISNTRATINDKISDDICSYPKDNYLIVHKNDVNPCEYVLAILKGKGLKDYII